MSASMSNKQTVPSVYVVKLFLCETDSEAALCVGDVVFAD